MKMINLTTDIIKSYAPCYCPTKYLDKDWEGSLVDILRMDKVSVLDRLWVARHAMDDKGNRLFAVWCAREVLKMLSDPDPRSIEACNVAERYANGEATKEELKVARTAAAATAPAAAAAAHAADAAATAGAAAATAGAAYAAADATYAAWATATWDTTNAAADAAAYAADAAHAAHAATRQVQINYLIKEMG